MAAKIFPSSHTHRLTLRRDGPAVICPQLAQRHVAGRAWWTHPHTVGVVGSEERAGWTVFEQRRQNQHRMPPAVSHLGHSLWERNVISCHFLIPARTHTTHITSRSYHTSPAYQVLWLGALVWSLTLQAKTQNYHHKTIKYVPCEWLLSYFLFTLMLLNFIPQRYVAAKEAVSWVSLVSCRHFLHSGLVHWTWKEHIIICDMENLD